MSKFVPPLHIVAAAVPPPASFEVLLPNAFKLLQNNSNNNPANLKYFSKSGHPFVDFTVVAGLMLS